MPDRSFARRSLAVLVLASTASAQAVLEWDREPQIDSPYRLSIGSTVADSAGGWYLPATRMQFSFGAGVWLPAEALLLRYDSAGTLTSTRSLATGSGTGSIVVDPAGGHWVSVGSSAITLKKYDAAGVEQLAFPLPQGFFFFLGLGMTPAGDVLAASENALGSWSPAGVQNYLVPLTQPNAYGAAFAVSATGLAAVARSAGAQQALIDVVRPDGSIAWSTAAAGSNVRYRALHLTPAGELLAAGDVGTYPAQSATLTKWSSTGVLLWTHTHPALASSFHAIATAPDGRIAVAGNRNDQTIGGTSDALVALLDADGTHRWTSAWTLSAASSRHRFDRVVFDSGGQIVVAGSASLNTTSLQSQLQSAPVIAGWSSGGALAWQYVGASMHNEDLVNALHETASGSFVFSAKGTSFASSFPTPASGRLLSVRPSSIAYCFGDGTGTACPCANESAPGSGTGCLHSNGSGGRLVSSGVASLSADTLVLEAAGMPATTWALYFQGTARVNGGAGAVLGDGLRCAGGSTIRLGTKINSAGASQYPSGADPAIHVQGGVTTGGTRHYQVIYRNAATYCTSSPFNATNGVEILWTS